ncbi:LytR/AlgR family response regulator transcription factor [Anaerosacchariphilus polymeriproducens]|uniref:Stage 0 sporulation protein A homolog n=1 Tax=Anaerosacchariphilus polymeriproducens TaxID=1812858 RepID=A0A371AY20_9FIRM|nr:LytTR family DNA-binding domain-containing protein [Anaerosacchariphilus polymeriproducens]RDU24463.1 DNA-binding response regulator [Anaerosacchariphilus polymeriproducens]
MLRIAVCEDDIAMCTSLDNYLYSLRRNLKIEIDVESFFTYDGLYESLMRGERYDIVFLDIVLGDKNGIDLGKIIRDKLKDEDTYIVFISSQECYAMELFDVRPFHFLIKPLNKDRVFEVVEKIVELLDHTEKYFIYKKAGESCRVPINDILYFESENRKIHIHTIDGIKDFYGKLPEVYEKLDKMQFIYIHKSYLVNDHQIVKLEYEQVTLSNGEVLRISQSKRKEVREIQMMVERRRRIVGN